MHGGCHWLLGGAYMGDATCMRDATFLRVVAVNARGCHWLQGGGSAHGGCAKEMFYLSVLHLQLVCSAHAGCINTDVVC